MVFVKFSVGYFQRVVVLALFSFSDTLEFCGEKEMYGEGVFVMDKVVSYRGVLKCDSAFDKDLKTILLFS